MYTSRASGAKCEAVPGPAQFKLRTPQAMSHVLGSDCSTAIRIHNMIARGREPDSDRKDYRQADLENNAVCHGAFFAAQR
eukprot:121582-Alexandrium_andersonii.AAC.1